MNAVHFRKAFNCVHRPALYKILEQFQMPTKLVSEVVFHDKRRKIRAQLPPSHQGIHYNQDPRRHRLTLEGCSETFGGLNTSYGGVDNSLVMTANLAHSIHFLLSLFSIITELSQAWA